jgi:hypothetical protein
MSYGRTTELTRKKQRSRGWTLLVKGTRFFSRKRRKLGRSVPLARQRRAEPTVGPKLHSDSDSDPDQHNDPDRD